MATYHFLFYSYSDFLHIKKLGALTIKRNLILYKMLRKLRNCNSPRLSSAQGFARLKLRNIWGGGRLMEEDLLQTTKVDTCDLEMNPPFLSERL